MRRDVAPLEEAALVDDGTAALPLAAVFAVPALLGLLGWAFIAVAVVDGLPTTSPREQRSLAAWPRADVDAVLTGRWARAVDAWVVDHVPLRDALLELAARLRDARGLAPETALFSADALGDFGLGPAGGPAPAVRGDDVAPPPAGRAQPAVADVDDGAGVEGAAPWPRGARRTDDDNNPAADRAAASRGASATTDGGVLRRGIVVLADRALMLQEGDVDDARFFAAALNAWARALPDVRLSALITPTASHFHLPSPWRARSAAQDQLLAAVRDALVPRVRWVDVTAALAPHVDDEALFYRTDHHWTARGAWHAYAAWAAGEGLRPVDPDTLTRRVHPPSLGSLYRITQARALRDRPDPVEYWLPGIDYTAERWRSLAEGPQPTRFLVETEANYATFLGGDDPLLIARTRAGTGRRLLLVKNSYGNALAPWLLHHFDEVVVVDYRYFVGDLPALAALHGITDVLLQNATATMNARSHARRMQALVTEPDADGVRPVDDIAVHDIAVDDLSGDGIPVDDNAVDDNAVDDTRPTP
jgi:hypothetical protein